MEIIEGISRKKKHKVRRRRKSAYKLCQIAKKRSGITMERGLNGVTALIIWKKKRSLIMKRGSV